MTSRTGTEHTLVDTTRRHLTSIIIDTPCSGRFVSIRLNNKANTNFRRLQVVGSVSSEGSQRRTLALSSFDYNTMKVVVHGHVSNSHSGSKDTTYRAKIPRGLRSLPITTQSATSGRSELDRLQQEAAQIERWWSDAFRWRHTKRVYSGTTTPFNIC